MDISKPKLVSLAVFICLLSACENGNSAPEDPKTSAPGNGDRINNVKISAKTPYGNPVQRVSGSGPVTVTLPGLTGHSVFLVTVNTSGSEVDGMKTGYVLSYNDKNARSEAAGGADGRSLKPEAGLADTGATVSGVFTDDDGENVVRYEHNGKNREILDAIRQGRLSPPDTRAADLGLPRSRGTVPAPPSYTVGSSTKEFWVQDTNGKFKKVTATLRSEKTHSNVWVVDENYDDCSADNNDNKINSARAQELADKFDTIYARETPVFGYEYGGDVQSGEHGYGGVDCDPKIQILVYDIDGDYTASQRGGVFGYFFSGDELTQSDFDSNKYYNKKTIKTNQAEMFYIDAHFTDLAPASMYSTLAHEFQHMINFNQKTLKHHLVPVGVWYNEMLSMLAEDLIDPFIGITVNDKGHPVKVRIPDFLQYYWFADPAVWLGGDDVYHSYANAYALGAYLARNFGGANLVKEIMSNQYVDAASLSAALANGANPLAGSVNSFTKALERYGEAMLFNQSDDALRPGRLSFNKTVKVSIGGTDYTFSGFDIWAGGSGPYVYNTNKAYTLKPRTMLLMSNNAWQKLSGTLSVTVQPPSAFGVECYVMVR
ncbi:MAG: hypothetical protein LBO04_04230 [Spirochaetaceae bacterium]|jgi:hypothetical protein|nr:hypothetical protein [Spirochaetaceae bacterium]